MQILALYDIHGNVEALDAVLADPRAGEPDAVVVGGDAVPGAFARRTLERLEALAVPVHWLRGNGEREMAEAVGAPEPAEDDVIARYAQLSLADAGEERARALGALPLTVELDGVTFFHATPASDMEILTRISAPGRWAAALAGLSGLAVAGHTHQQDDRIVDGVRFVNAGSVGLPYEGDGAARWAWIAGGEPALRSTAYDAAGAGARMLAAGWPDERSIAAALTDPIDPNTITTLFEERATAER
jgi:predicted phosphodiesterase